ncbi:glycosyl transferase family 1 [Sphaerisporangium krabiense]|uniref:Glycosyltransferase involved in cell wall biosynthesis n=1 Tax=Sphaerisporangium krabiense TaxID=763782 RepID=A0A7W8Z5F7_9ACTN|nr:glycosyltransferase family 4 protein [Sphaerisporangium krabiense]MBB5627722.1 glycosyltransferase involved in cell wall biosynthesis [Sphaerisporangium krabiense]GII61880.1 glycosyl transferase family 1 [Sphaerisporangium krabiense]
MRVPGGEASDGRLRVALLSYRSKPTCGGQGVYLRHLSRELVALGHYVEVFSGPPYPELDEGVVLTRVPSLDLYRDEDPFRTPRLAEYRDWIDVLEVATMWTAGFPEPLTFSLRALREMKRRAGDFDVVQDNQTLGYGLLGIQKLFPVVGTIHHPISVDRRIELEAAAPLRKKLSLRRWYGFVRMQSLVAPRLKPILTVSESSLADIHRDFNVPQSSMRLIPLGVDTRYFHPRPHLPKRPGSIVAVASADSPMKGVATLLRAVAKLATERDVNLTVVSRPTPGGPTEKLVQELALGERVRFVHGISDDELGELIATSEISVVPSLYEGFSLPAVEHMACGTPLVASRTGALPEVVGDAAVQVAPGDAEELAAVLRRLHDSPAERERVGKAGYDRVMERFTWHVVAKRTVEAYREAIAAHAGGRTER